MHRLPFILNFLLCFTSINARDLQQIDDYYIDLAPGGLTIEFNDEDVSADFIYDLKIKAGQSDELLYMKAFDYDTCATSQYGSDVIQSFYNVSDLVDIGEGYESVGGISKLFLQNVTKPEYEGAIAVPIEEEPGYSNLRFCVQARIGAFDSGPDPTEINFIFLRFEIKILLTSGFSSEGDSGFAGFNTITMDDDGSDGNSFTASLVNNYDLNTCICTPSNKECINDPPTYSLSNAVLSICFETPDSKLSIANIKSLVLEQGLYKVFAVNNYEYNSITFPSSMTTNKEFVTTRLTSVFFFDDSLPVTISGVAILGFADNGRRKLVQMRSGINSNYRSLQAEEESEGAFQIEVNVSSDDSVGPNDGDSMTNPVGSFLGLILFSFLLECI